MLTNNQNTFSPLSTHRTFGTVNGGQMNRPQGMKSRSVPYHQHLLKFANVDFLHVTECSSGPTFAQEQYFSQVSNNKILHLGSGDTYGQLVVYRKDWHVTALSNGSNILNPMAWTGIDPLVKATLTYCHGRHIFLKIVTDMGNTLYYLGIHNSRETEGNIAENEKIGWVVQLLTNLGVDFIVGGDFNKGLYEGSKSRPRQTSVNRIQQGVFQFHNNPLEATTTALNKVYAIDYMGTGFSTNYFKYQSYDLLKEDFYVFPKGNHYPIIIYVQETLNKQINYQGLIQGPHYQQVAYVNYNRQQIDQGYNHNYMVYQRNIQPSYTQSLDDDFLRTFYYNNWNSTQAQFCRDFKIDAGNFSNWLRRKLQSSPASKNAVQSYYQMMNFSM